MARGLPVAARFVSESGQGSAGQFDDILSVLGAGTNVQGDRTPARSVASSRIGVDLVADLRYTRS